MRKKALVSIIIFIAVLIIDQIIKVEVKTGMFLGERIHITDWFQLVFVENPGMAFGWEIAGGKLFLTLFRIIAVSAIGWFISKEIRSDKPMGYIVCLSLIMAGAMGNIIDCLFYGMIFNAPAYPEVAQFVPWGTGYGEFFYGKVVDMFYFPLIEWDMPEISWLPYTGEHCVFFSPIFNFADASISCGIIALILFYNKTISKIGLFQETEDKETPVREENINDSRE